MANTVTLDFSIPADTPAGDPSYSLDATLTLSATANAQGYYTVEGASGTIDIGGTTYDVTGVSGADLSDNLFNPNGLFSGATSGSTSFVDNAGLSFVTTDPNADASGTSTPSADVNFYFNNSGDYFVDGSSQSPIAATSVSVTNLTLCFCSGTRIRTVRGEVAVEDLVVGDEVVTASGGARPITWIGSRKVERLTRDGCPVRILAGAFGEHLPDRDLRLSAGHAIRVDAMGEVFIPAGRLVNGATIVREEVAEVTYWHIELESHDVLLAEGLPCESYLEMSNRAWFGRAYGRLETVDPDRDPMAEYARPLVDRGPIVAAVKSRLAARAEALGWTRTKDLGLHMLVDGRRIEPDIDGDLARFIFPAEAECAVLVSRVFSPAWTDNLADQRELGVSLRRLRVSDGLRTDRDIPLDHPALGEGFHAAQSADGEVRRWTGRAAVLPAALWEGCRGQVVLQIEFGAGGRARWQAPEADRSVRSAA